jgi:hypothetical protein
MDPKSICVNPERLAHLLLMHSYNQLKQQRKLRAELLNGVANGKPYQQDNTGQEQALPEH